MRRVGDWLRKASDRLRRPGDGLRKVGNGLGKAGNGLRKAGNGLTKARTGVKKERNGLRKAGDGLRKPRNGLRRPGDVGCLQSREMQPAGLKFAYWLRAAPHTHRSVVFDLHRYMCCELWPCWGTHMWHDCVAVALAVSAGWRALAHLLEA